jgi:NADH dehydrogenase
MIRRDLERRPRYPFRYRNKGDLATIGRLRAIAVFGERSELTGTIAWLFWLFVHIMYLAGFRNRLSVMLQWAFAFFTYQRGSRLIIEAVRRNPAPSAAEPVAPKW